MVQLIQANLIFHALAAILVFGVAAFSVVAKKQ
jgi:hypothetical protein